MSGVALVQFSCLDLAKLLPLARQSLDRSLSEAADSVDAEPPLHHLLCIAAMKEPHLKPTASSCVPYANLFHAGFLIAAHECDMAEVFETCGMPCIMVESIERGVNVAFVSGTLEQWKTAVLRGCVREVSREVRHTFNLIYTEFNKLGLSAIFEARKTEANDHTFLLEYHP